MTPLKFIHTFDMHSAPPDLRERTKLNLLDLIGIAAAGRQTRLAQIINITPPKTLAALCQCYLMAEKPAPKARRLRLA